MTTAQTSEAGQGSASESAGGDLTQQPTLFVIGYAHLDTEWRWEYPQVIREYLSKTMRNNFALFDKYPHYIFNFTGSNRYEMMKEYYPADFARLKRYVAAGRWFPAGSSVEENDVNSPSAESIIRQVLHGNEFFRHEFGKASDEYMLPDCFGFPASLPSILAHAGIRGFSTQKLSAAWQPAPHVGGPDSPEKTPEGIPFNVGLWEGPDGRTVLAALNPGSYDGDVYTDLTKNNTPPAGQQGADYVWDWPDRVNLDGKVTGIYADYHYVGTGDIGGSPNEDTVKLMEAIETKSETPLPSIPTFGSFEEQQPAKPGPPVRLGTGPLRVVWSDADTLFGEIKPSQTSRMPRYKGDLELINHSAGSLTSQAYHKRWNRENEVLADAAEKASVGAAWLGGQAYPQARLNRAWRLVLGGQFHDIMAGTATPQSYVHSWNDDVLALNQFAGVLTIATEAVASVMDTQAQGTPVVVFNQLNIPRQDVVEVDDLPFGSTTIMKENKVVFSAPAPSGVRVLGPDGQEVPAQLEPGRNGLTKVVFLASVPSVGYAVYDIQPAGAPPSSSTLRVSSSFLENARYRVQIDDNGDVSGIFDKKLNRELLSAPLRLAISMDNPRQWPAWNMDFEDEQRPPRAYVGGPAHVRVVEQGPARVAVEISREGENSKFVQTIRLSAGDAGNRIEVVNAIDWAAKQANLKETFPLSASNPMATYNWDIGTVERPNETLRQFEVASHRWIDLTDRSGSYGVTVLTDAKNGSDKPSDNTLRLTLLRTPGTRGGYEDQGTQDWGRHEFVFGLAGHEGDWRQGQTDWQAYRLNEPLIAFETSPHAGALGKKFSLLRVSSSRVCVMAMKKAEESDLVIVRLVEISGRAEPNVHLAFAGPVTAAREVNGQEQPVGPATIENGELVTSFSGYQPRSFAVELAAPHTQMAAPESQPVTLNYDASVATLEGRPGEGCFDCDLNNQTSPQGNALPAEMLPSQLSYGSIQFQLAPAGLGKPEAVTAQGQTIQLPTGDFNRLYLLAAAYGGDQEATFQVASPSTVSRIGLNIEDWGGYIGQWDTRIWNEKKVEFRVPSEPAPDDKSPRAQRARRIRAYVKEHGPIFRTEMEYAGLKPAYVKRAPVAWFASHHHAADGASEPYSYSYLFAYDLELPAGATALTLPDNKRIRLLAATVAKESPQVTPAHPLYDMLERANIDMGRWNASLNPMNPASLAFGAAPVGSASQPQSVTLTNTRSEDLTVRDIQISGDFSQSNDCATLHPGARCTIQVTFQPAAVGTRSGILTVPGNASENLAVALTGTGLGGASAKVGFGDGFFGPGLQSLALNGNASIFHRRLRLTDGGDQEAASAFTSNLVNVASFTNDFSFQLTDADADGFTFAIQADSPRVVGPPGGGLGYGPDAPGGQPSGIPKSMAVKFDLWSNAGESADGTGMYIGGASPTVPDVDLSDKGIDLHDGDIFYVHMTYDGAILAWTITDSATGRSFSTSAPLNISRVLGANTGYVGFTAATGGLASTQEILAWTFQ
jgi:alpha-mannosidase